MCRAMCFTSFIIDFDVGLKIFYFCYENFMLTLENFADGLNIFIVYKNFMLTLENLDVVLKFFLYCEKIFLELNVEINAGNMSARVVEDLISDRRNLGSDPAGDGLLSFYFSLFAKKSFNFGF